MSITSEQNNSSNVTNDPLDAANDPNSRPDPVIQTLIDGSQVTVDPSQYEISSVEGEIVPGSVTDSGLQINREDNTAAEEDLASDFATDGHDLDVESLRGHEPTRH